MATETIIPVERKSSGQKVKMPLGSVVIRDKNGRRTRYIKVREDGPKSRHWMAYARWWWETNRGPVPDGHLVLHKDGDELNDSPENLMVGTNGTKLKLLHENNPEWSKAQHERAAKACGEYNKVTGQVNRLEEILSLYWYPVLDRYGVILNVPWRRLKPMLEWFKVDVDFYPKNGRWKKVLRRVVQETGIRPVRGEDLKNEYYEEYVYLEPGMGIGSRTKNRMAAEDKIKLLENDPIYLRAKEAAELPLRQRN